MVNIARCHPDPTRGSLHLIDGTGMLYTTLGFGGNSGISPISPGGGAIL